MDEAMLYEEQKEKLDELCSTHHLFWNFNRNSYPLTLTIRPENPYAGQLSMLGSEDETGTGEASMTWVFQNGVLSITTRGTFTISKTVRDKIESTLTKMISFWLQHFFRVVVESGKRVEADDERGAALDGTGDGPASGTVGGGAA